MDTQTQQQGVQFLLSEIVTLSEVQRTAIDLHRRGFNVMPLPRKHLVKNWAARKPKERSENDKPPYLLYPFFTARMHLCGAECFRNEQSTGRRHKGSDFIELFEGENIGLMTGRTSGNLVSADCDDHKKYQWVIDQATARNLPYMAYSTHRGGQVLFRIIEGEAKNIGKNKALIPDVEIWGNSHYIVIPPSIHPLGTVYQWTTKAPAEMATGETLQAVPVESLSWLGVVLNQSREGEGKEYEAPELFGLPEWTVILSRNNRRILGQAAQLTGGERNNMLRSPVYAIAARIRSGDVSYSDGLGVLEIAGRACGQDAKKMLDSAMKKSSLNIETDNKVRHLKSWERAAEFMKSHDWAGHFGRSAQGARAAFDACLQRAALDKSQTFRASLREIADKANFADHKRAGRIMHKLQTEKPALIKWVGESDTSGSYIYALEPITQNLRNDPSITTIAVDSGVISQSPKTQTQKDVFRALGQIAWQVWQYLLTTPAAKKSEIAKAIGQNAASVGRAIDGNENNLMRYGLVVFGGDGIYYGEPKSDSELEKLAAVLGTYGKADKTRRNFEKERGVLVNNKIAKARAYWHESFS